MKGATTLTTLQTLGVMPSLSRPGVSNDNVYSESLFKTLKYLPRLPAQGVQYPVRRPHLGGCAGALVQPRTAAQRDPGRDTSTASCQPRSGYSGSTRGALRNCNAAQSAPMNGRTRNWQRVGDVHLNPDRIDDHGVVPQRRNLERKGA